MSWTRRLLVLIAFVLMIGGVALMIALQNELFLALSVSGFVLMLAAVPSLPREPRQGEEPVDEPREPPAPGPEAEAVPERQRTGNVTVLPRRPNDVEAAAERAALEPPPGPDEPSLNGDGPDAKESEARPAPEVAPPSEVAPASGETPASEAPVEPSLAPAPALPEPSDGPRRGEEEVVPVDAARAQADPAHVAAAAEPHAARGRRPADVTEGRRPADVTEGRRPADVTEGRPADVVRASDPADVSPRKVAVATAAAAAVVWLWRRARR